MLQIHPPHRELHRTPANLKNFWVIIVCSNPVRYKRRYELAWRTMEMLESCGVNYILVEQAFGDRQFMLSNPDKPHHLRLRSLDELWHKENMVNLGVRHAMQISQGNAKEVAWIDADCRPTSPYLHWFEETWHQLQHYEFVQMWQWALDLDVNHNPIGNPWHSFMHAQQCDGDPVKTMCPPSPYYDENPHPHGPKGPRWGAPGLAWAANVDAFNKIGGIPDYAILGAGDWYLAHMLTTGLPLTEMGNYSPGYRGRFEAHQHRITRWIKRDVGCVPGMILHDFHGKKKNRFYQTREKILMENAYDPNTDIKVDSQGLYQLETWEDRQIRMRDLIRGYFRARNEDSIDLV